MIFFTEMGKLFLIFGGIFILLGLIFIFSGKISFLGKLPGDIVIEKENFRFYFPLVTSILISLILTIILNFIFWILKK